MPTNILMPALSPTMEKGKLAKWLKKEGDRVSPGDVIAEIETDKATMEVELIDEGTLGRIVVPEGTDDIAVNSLIAVLLGEGENAATISAGPGKTASAPAAAVDSKEARKSVAEPAPAKDAKSAEAASPAPVKHADGARLAASPLARRLAREKGVALGAREGYRPQRTHHRPRHRRRQTRLGARRGGHGRDRCGHGRADVRRDDPQIVRARVLRARAA